MENMENHNIYDSPQQLNLTDNLWYIPEEPLIFFTYDYKVEKMACSFRDAAKALCESDIIELGDVDTDDDGNVLFKIMRKDYLYYCRLNTDYHNIVVSRIIENAHPKEKESFIRGGRKAIKLKGSGCAFFVRELSKNELIIESGCADALKKKLYSPERMSLKGIEELKEFILEDDSFTIDGTSFLAKKILKTVKGYSDIEYELDKEKAQNDPGIVYVSRKSLKMQQDQNQKYVYEFVCLPFEAEEYRAGCEIFVKTDLDNGRHGTEYGNIILIDELEDDLKKVIITFKEQFHDRELPQTGGEIKKAASASQKRVREEVVNQFKRKQVRSQYMYHTFEPYDKFETEGFDEQIDPQPVFDSMEARKAESNDSQKEAIKAGIQTKDIALILGPPGTGKTTVIVEWVLHFIKQKKRVLISSKNNKAVDNVFERISKFRQQDEYKDLGMIRIGNADKVQANVRSFLPENQHNEILSIITKHTNKSSATIREDLNTVHRVKAELKNIQEHSEEFFKLRNILLKEYASLYEKGTVLIDLKKKIDVQKTEREKIFSVINRKRIYLEEAEKKSFLIKLLTAFITKRVQKQYQALLQKVKATASYEANVNLYNEKALEFRREYENDAFKKLKADFSTVRERTFREELKIDATFTLPMGNICYVLSENEEELHLVSQQVCEIATRLENISSIIEEWVDNVKDKDNDVLSEILVGNSAIVGATCIGINSNRVFRNVDFDVAIIDEAGQIQVHDIIVPMSRAEKTLMLGDHKQIPPNVDQKMLLKCQNAHLNTDFLKRSFFEFLYDDKRFPQENKFMLNTQFRMPKEIADILSAKFYNGQYLSTPKKADMPSLCPQVFTHPFVIIDTSDNSPVYRHERMVDGKCYNPCEIDVIVKLLDRMNVGEGNPIVGLDDIGIISPYKRQAEMLRESVHKNFNLLSKTQVESMIASLDSFQGQERELIIYSCTRSNEWKSIGFLSELRRINVAMSRCKSQLVLVGDFNFLTTCSNVSEDDFKPDETPQNTGFVDLGEDADTPEEQKQKLAKEREKMEFAHFMQEILDAVQSGSGQYMMSKEL